MFIASFLGPYYLGIWGFINLVLSYSAQLNLGISHSVNVLLSVNKQNEKYVKQIIGNGLSMVLGLSVVVALFYLFTYFGGITIGEKFNFYNYLLPVVVIAIITHFNGLLSNIFRVYGKVFAIAINQSLYPIMILVVFPFFRGENLLWAMVLTNLASVLIALAIFIIQSPVRLNLRFNFNLIKHIQQKGWYLFIYNTAFYFILLSTNTFVSRFYSVEQYGLYTFSFTLANTVLLLLNSISYLIFPKMINRLSRAENEQIRNLLVKTRAGYTSLSHLLIHTLIVLVPLLLVLFPQYEGIDNVFKMIALTLAVYTNLFGYQSLLIARNKEKFIANISLISLILNIVLTYVLITIMKAPLYLVISGTMIVYFIYVLTMGVAGRKEIGLTNNILQTLKDTFPIRIMIPYIVSLFLIQMNVGNVFFIIPLVLYLLLNINDLKETFYIIVTIVRNPNIINI